MTLKIMKSVVIKLFEHAMRDAPIEACGYIAGNGEIVSEAVCMNNIDQSPEHFSFDPQEQFNVVRELRKKGLKIMGVYHSHPVSPPRMSQEDIRLAYDQKISYIIVSLQDKPFLIKSFRKKGQTIVEEDIEILE
jgi:proteasome lid subunit RPN8/RPN11